MNRPVLALSPVILIASALVTGCGYVGDPLPPSLNIPQPVTDLKTVERADAIVVEFTIPALTTDGVVLRRLGKVDLRAGPGNPGPFEVQKWAESAKPIPNEIARPGRQELKLPARDWAGQEIILAVRVSGPKGRFSEWSNLAVQHVVAPLEKPAAVRAEAVPEGVRLSWAMPAMVPGLAFRIYRAVPPGSDAGGAEIGTSDGPQFVDTAAEFGKTYRYTVQGIVKSGDSLAESDISDSVTITPADKFPPAVPGGLSAIPAVRSVDLTWDRNTEPDLKGYYLYRSAGNGPATRVGDLLETPSYRDREIESGKQYGYAVSAVDQLGNESARSASIEVTAP